MEAQQTLVVLEAAPVPPNHPNSGAQPSFKLIFGQPSGKSAPSATSDTVSNPKLKAINRHQLKMKTVDLENLIERDHVARGIWHLMERVDFSAFYKAIRSQKGEKGRSSNSPVMMASVWIYAYSKAISSAREIERQMEYEPGLMWLCGDTPVNHHTLSDFRVGHKEALDELFKNVLAVLDGQGLIDLKLVAHDGTKIQANAGVDTYRRKNTIQQRLELAQQVIAEMGDPREDNVHVRTRKQAAEQRAARERVKKLSAALEEMEELSKDLKPADAVKMRVSIVEPEARKMKHGNAAITPGYNVQLSTEASNKIIVGMHLSQSSSDAQSLQAAVDVVENNNGRCPDQLVVDGGYTSKANVVEMEERGIDLIGSLPDLDKKRTASARAAGIDPSYGVPFFIIQSETKTVLCPEGKTLNAQSKSGKRGNLYQIYRAQGSDCERCPSQKKCCPRKPEQGRSVAIMIKEDAPMANFREKMESEQAKQVYKQRGAVAEFPNAWIKEKLGLRKYRVRGLVKAGIETAWACLTYNVQQWVRLSWRQVELVGSAR